MSEAAVKNCESEKKSTSIEKRVLIAVWFETSNRKSKPISVGSESEIISNSHKMVLNQHSDQKQSMPLFQEPTMDSFMGSHWPQFSNQAHKQSHLPPGIRRPRAETFSAFLSNSNRPESSALLADEPSRVEPAQPRTRTSSLSLPQRKMQDVLGPSIFPPGNWDHNSMRSSVNSQPFMTNELDMIPSGSADGSKALAMTLDYLGLDDPPEFDDPFLTGNQNASGARIRSISLSVSQTQHTQLMEPLTMVPSLPINATVDSHAGFLNPRPRSTTIAYMESASHSFMDGFNINGNENSSVDLIEQKETDSRHLNMRSNFNGASVPSNCLWAVNIDPKLSVADVSNIFGEFGDIDSLRLLANGEAFVSYVNAEDAIIAKNRMQGAQIGKYTISVGFGKGNPIQDSQRNPASKSIWVGNLSHSVTPDELNSLFAQYGTVDAARVVHHKSCGFVNFARLEDAIVARAKLDGIELGGSVLKVGFAKAVKDSEKTQSGSSRNASDIPSSQTSPQSLRISALQSFSGSSEVSRSTTPAASVSIGSSRPSPFDPQLETVNPSKKQKEHTHSASNADVYQKNIPPLSEAGSSRKIDQHRMREMRKRLEDSKCSSNDVEAVFNEVIGDAPQICADYIGNVVIQEVFVRTGEGNRMRLIEELAPYFATLGIHKNGTFAIQKIINTVNTAKHIEKIVSAVKPYTPLLLLDQYGNYVVQCCLRFGAQYNNFMYDAMIKRCADLAIGRYGSRSMRTCLESKFATKVQKKGVAIALLEDAVNIAMNPNGAVLMTWLMDISGIPGRYAQLALKFAPHITSMCVNKLSNGCIMKMINQKEEQDARRSILSHVFNNKSNLEHIILDPSNGLPFIQRILSPECRLSDKERSVVASRVGDILTELPEMQKRQSNYKRLLEIQSRIPYPTAADDFSLFIKPFTSPKSQSSNSTANTPREKTSNRVKSNQSPASGSISIEASSNGVDSSTTYHQGSQLPTPSQSPPFASNVYGGHEYGNHTSNGYSGGNVSPRYYPN